MNTETKDKELTKKYVLNSLLIFIFLLLDIWMMVPYVKLREISFASLFTVERPKLDIVLQMYKKPWLSLSYMLNIKVFLMWALISILVWGFIYGLIYILTHMETATNVDENGKEIAYAKNNGTYGTAQWMELEKLKTLDQYLDIESGKGIVFGKLKDDPNKLLTLNKGSWYNRNVAVIGTSGSKKSRAFSRPNIFNLAILGDSMLVTDPKGELARDCIPMLKSMGYITKILNLVDPIYSDRWNIIESVTDDLSAATFAQVILDNTTNPNEKADKFWERTEMNLLKALALYVALALPKEEANMGTMMKFIAAKDTQIIEKVFSTLPDGHPALPPYYIYRQAQENVQKGVIIGLGTRLQIFQSKLLQKLTEKSEIDLLIPGVQKCAYFIVVPDTESTFDLIPGLFFSFFFIKQIKIADYNGGLLPIQVNCVLDEFPNIARIPEFTKKISTIRSRGVNTFVIFQNIAQFQNRYPNNEWAEILGNCDTQLFLGCNEDITAEFISESLGVTTVRDFSVSKEQGLEGLTDFGKRSDKYTERMLLLKDEVRKYNNDEAILMMRGQDPLKLIKFDYTEHPLAVNMKPKMLKEYKREWAAEFKDLEKYNEELYSIDSIRRRAAEQLRLESISNDADNEQQEIKVEEVKNSAPESQLQAAETSEESKVETKKVIEDAPYKTYIQAAEIEDDDKDLGNIFEINNLREDESDSKPVNYEYEGIGSKDIVITNNKNDENIDSNSLSRNDKTIKPEKRNKKSDFF